MTAFRFGVICSGPPRDDRWTAWARELHDLGYGTLSLTDHVDGQYAIGPALAAAFHVAPGLRFASLVHNAELYPPVLLAREALTLAHLSGGRFELGLGTGWKPADFARVGVPFRPFGERLERLEETLRIIRLCFAGGPFRFVGKHFSVVADVAPAPAAPAAGPPPVLVGGGGRRVLELAGAYADIVSVNPRLGGGSVSASALVAGNGGAGTDRKLEWVRAGAGDRFDAITRSVSVYHVVCGDDQDLISRRLAARAGVDSVEVLDNPHVLIGTPRQMCEALRRRRDRWGFTQVVIDELRAQEFAPVVAELAGA